MFIYPKQPTFDRENSILAIHPDCTLVGMDEVGCGPFAGPLVAGAVVCDHQSISFLDKIRDSKLLSAKQREDIYQRICDEPAMRWAVGVVTVVEIDSLGLKKALPLAYKRCFDALIVTHPIMNLLANPWVLMDGVRDPRLGVPTTLIKQGDRCSYTIAAASIMAKVTRDRMMDALHDAYPCYEWRNNKGYGTAAHRAAIGQFGLTPHHRRSFKIMSGGHL